MKFNWAKAVGYGILIWAIMFGIGSILMLLNINVIDTVWAQVLMAIIAGAVAYGFASDIRPANASQAFGYGVVWVAVGLIVDAGVTAQFQPKVFTLWTYWLGYALILLSPWLQLESHTHARSSA